MRFCCQSSLKLIKLTKVTLTSLGQIKPYMVGILGVTPPLPATYWWLLPACMDSVRLNTSDLQTNSSVWLAWVGPGQLHRAQDCASKIIAKSKSEDRSHIWIRMPTNLLYPLLNLLVWIGKTISCILYKYWQLMRGMVENYYLRGEIQP